MNACLFYTSSMATGLGRVARQAALLSPLGEMWLVLPAGGMRDQLDRRVAKAVGVSAGLRPCALLELLTSVFLPPEVRGESWVSHDTAALSWVLCEALGSDEGLLNVLPQVWQDRLAKDSGIVSVAQHGLAQQLAQALEDALTYRGAGWLRDKAHPVLRAAWNLEKVRVALSGHLSLQVQDDTGAWCLSATQVEERLVDFRERHPRVERVGMLLSSALAPLHWQCVQALMNQSLLPFEVVAWGPSDAYWADASLKRDRWRAQGDEVLEHDEFFPGGLLHSLGRSSKQLHIQLIDGIESAGQGVLDLDADVSDLPPESVLQALQQEAREARPLSQQGDSFVSDPQDTSLLLHGCPGRMRMAEVVRDQAREALEAGIALEDIVVLMADPARDGPLLKAVFESEQNRRMLLSVQDGPTVTGDVGATAMLALLETLAGRATLQQGLDLLSHSVVSEAVGLSQDDVQLLGQWLAEAGVRFAWSAEHRKQLGRDGEDRASWQAGVRRLMLGALTPDAMLDASRMPESLGELGNDSKLTAPVHRASGLDRGCVQRIAVFVDKMAQFSKLWSEPMTRVQGVASLREMVLWLTHADMSAEGRAIEPGDVEQGGQVLVAALHALEKELQGLREDVLMMPAMWRQLMVAHLELAGAAQLWRGGGGVRALALRRGHGVVARAVFVMGLDQGQFPRRTMLPAFHPFQVSRQLGDRNERDADRQWLLESVLSATDRVGLFYDGGVGEEMCPPSPVAADVLASAVKIAGRELEKEWHIKHPRLPVSPDYFAAGRRAGLQTRSSVAYQVASLLRSTSQTEDDMKRTLASVKTSEDSVDVTQKVALSSLRKWLDSPTRICAQQQGFASEQQEEMLLYEDKLSWNGIEKWQVRDTWMNLMLSGKSVEADVLRRQGLNMCPVGKMGEKALEKMSEEVERQCEEWAKVAGEKTPGSLSVEVQLSEQLAGGDGLAITGEVTPVASNVTGDVLTYISWSASEIKGKHLWRGALDGLALATLGDEEGACWKVLDKGAKWHQWTLLSSDKAREMLARLARVYALSTHVPMPWLPQFAWAWCENYVQTRSEDIASDVARGVLDEGGYQRASEREQSDELRLFFGDEDVFAWRTPESWRSWAGEDWNEIGLVTLLKYIGVPLMQTYQGVHKEKRGKRD